MKSQVTPNALMEKGRALLPPMMSSRLGKRASWAVIALTMASPMIAFATPSDSSTISYHRAQIGGVGVFYREAGSADAPTVVLLHGYPSSSRQYASLIPLLATRFHVIAPDYPGFGQSDAPAPAEYQYTFDNLARTTNGLLESLKISRYVLYLQDYGGPVGFRIAEAHPERLRGLVIQNANAYKEGLGKNWTAIGEYWAHRDDHPEVLDKFLSLDLTKQRHIVNSPNPERYDPSAWLDEYAFLSRPGEREIQANLLYDYRTNVQSYPEWQAWLREHKPPTLVMWGKYDPSFITPGALAYKKDLPAAEVDILDAGHFATEEKVDEIAQHMVTFMEKLPN